MHYIYRNKENTNNIIIDRQPNKQVLLLGQKDGKTIPLIKCSETRLSSIFSNPTRSFERITARLDWDNTSRVIRYILEGEEDSKQWFKPSSVIQSELLVMPNNELTEITLEFRVMFHLYKKVYEIIDDKETKHWRYLNIRTEELVYTFNMSAHDYMNALAFVNIYDSVLALRLLKNGYPHYHFTNLYPLGPKKPIPWEGPDENDEPPLLDPIDPDKPPVKPEEPEQPTPPGPDNPNPDDTNNDDCCCCKYKKLYEELIKNIDNNCN